MVNPLFESSLAHVPSPHNAFTTSFRKSDQPAGDATSADLRRSGVLYTAAALVPLLTVPYLSSGSTCTTTSNCKHCCDNEGLLAKSTTVARYEAPMYACVAVTCGSHRTARRAIRHPCGTACVTTIACEQQGWHVHVDEHNAAEFRHLQPIDTSCVYPTLHFFLHEESRVSEATSRNQNNNQPSCSAGQPQEAVQT